MDLLPSSKIAVSNDRKIILAYSEINKRAKYTLLYSTLNPDTNSDSPSAKSKGLRLLSARQLTNHRALKGISIKPRGISTRNHNKSTDIDGKANTRKRMAKLTSYLTPWAKHRKDPTIAYIELEAQPTPRCNIPLRDILTITTKNNILAWVNPVTQGITDQTNKLILTDKTGHKITPNRLLLEGVEEAFANSLIASLKGCRSPKYPTILGPSRIWDNLKIFRS